MNKEKQSLIKEVSPSTAKSYAGSYERLRKILEMKDKRKPIKKISLDDVLDAIEKVDNPSTAYSVFVIAKKIYDYGDNKEKFDKLDNEIKKRKREIQVSKNKTLTQSLPTYKEISAAIKKEQDPRKYITSFIIFKISTRNQDVALADLHAHKKDNYDEKRNHLILDGNKVIFIRNIYKTAKKYGQKKNIIAVKKFADMVKELLGDADTKPLFARKNGEHITPASIASYLKKYVVLGLNEGIIMKAVLKYADEQGSYDMLRKISANRGTTIQVLLNEYDVSNIKEPSQEVKQEVDVMQEVKVE